MVKLLKYRAAFITLLFGLFGMALSNLLKMEDLKTIYTSVSFLISLAISLLVSFMLKLKWNTKTRNRIKLVSALLFFALLTSVFFYIKGYDSKTFSYRDKESGELSYHINGTKLQPKAAFFANQYLKEEGKQISEETLILKFNGPLNADDVWIPDTIAANRLYLIVNYIIIVILFVSLVCLLAEVLVSKYPKSTAKTIEDTDDNKTKKARKKSG